MVAKVTGGVAAEYTYPGFILVMERGNFNVLVDVNADLILTHPRRSRIDPPSLVAGNRRFNFDPRMCRCSRKMSV